MTFSTLSFIQGEFQQSNDQKLKMYAYFKQATEGDF